MGLATIEGLDFFGIPVHADLEKIGLVRGKKPHNAVREVIYLQEIKMEPLTKRRQDLIVAALNRGLYKMVMKICLDGSRRKYRKNGRVVDSIWYGMVLAASKYEPRNRNENGVRASFPSFAILVINHSIHEAIRRLLREPGTKSLKGTDAGDLNELPNMDFAPDLRTIPERWPEDFPDSFDIKEFSDWEPSKNPNLRFERREHDIFMRWEYAGQTLKEIGEFYSITRERVRQIAERYRGRLKKWFPMEK